MYVVTVSGAGGTSATYSIVIPALNSPQLSVNAGTISCNGDSASIIVSATGGTAPYTGTGTYTEPAGTYLFTVTDSNGCKASSNPLLVNGIENIAGDKIDIYPNPSYGGDWQLDVSEGLIGSKIEIYDADGRLVYMAEVRNLKTLVSLNVSSGIYLCMLHSNRINSVRKLVKL